MPNLPPSLSPPGNSNVYESENFNVVALFGNAALASYFGRGVTLARNSAGNYTLTLPMKYRRVTKLSGIMQTAAGAVLFPTLLTDTVSTDGKLVFETRTEAGVATDPATGNKLFLEVGVSNNFLNDSHVVTVA